MGFDEYLTILNPNATPVTLTLTYFRLGAAPLVRSKVVAANARATVVVHDEAEGVGRNGGAGWQVATKVESPSPIVVERPIYFRYGGAVDGGHNVMGYAP